MEAASRRVHRVRDDGASDRSRPARGVLDTGVAPVGVGAGTEAVPAPASGGGHHSGQTADWNSSWAHGSRALAILRWSWLLSQMTGHGSGPDGRTGLHPRRNSLERQGRFAPQPGGNSLKKSAVDLQALTTIQQNNLTSQRAPARVSITLTVCVTPHPSTTSRQHYFHRTAPLYMKRRIFFRNALQSW
jgi:hypothetical protein